MKRFFLAVLAFCSTSAFAHWTEVAKFATPEATIYLDLATIRAVGAYVRVWSLTNFTLEQTAVPSGKYRSARWLEEYDCANEQTRNVAFVLNADTDGQGASVQQDMDASRPTAWQVIVPDSIGQNKLRMACNPAKYTKFNTKGWMPITEQGGTKVAIDRASMRRDGDHLTVRALYDFSPPLEQPFGLPHASRVFTLELDCAQLSSAYSSLASYLGHGADGKVAEIKLVGAPEQRVILPDSLMDGVSKVVCALRQNAV